MLEDFLFVDDEAIEQLSKRVGGVVFATYQFPAKDEASARKLAVQIASGQTLGYLPDNVSFFEDYVGRVADVRILNSEEAVAKLVFPAKLFARDIAGLLTVLFGKISFSPGIQLVNVSGDLRFYRELKGPKFGSQGIRTLSRVESHKRPLLMAILKPGLGPDDGILAENYRRLVEAGTDLVKDDETRIDGTLDDTLRRFQKVMNQAKGRGIYVVHLTGPAFQLRERARKLQLEGVQAFLFCPFTYGLSMLQSLCEDPDIKVPIFVHPALTGIMTSSGTNRVHPVVLLGTLMRWAGADGVLYPSPYGSIALPKTEAQELHNKLSALEGTLKTSASVPSAGILPELVENLRADFGPQIIVNAGTGMARAEGGIEAGAAAFIRQIEQHFGA